MRQDRTSGLQMTCIGLSSSDFTCPALWHGLLSWRLLPECPPSFPCVIHCYVTFTFEKNCFLFLFCVKVAQRWPETSNGRRHHHLSPHGVRGEGVGDSWAGGEDGGSCPDSALCRSPRGFCCQALTLMRMLITCNCLFSFFFIQNVGVLRDRCIVFHCRCLFYISFIFVCILYILQLPQYPWLIRVITERNYYFNTLKLAQTFLSSGVRG